MADPRPQVKTVAVTGDGSFGFTCGKLETIVRLEVPITMAVIGNATYGWIKAGQKAGFGERYFSVDLTPGQHAGIAEAFGVRAWRVEDPADLKLRSKPRSRPRARHWSTPPPSPCMRPAPRSRNGSCKGVPPLTSAGACGLVFTPVK